MASYAALLSVLHTLNQIKNHPRPPIFIHQKQLHSLTQNLTFLQNFLERYSSGEDDDLESRIADAAYAVEDVIESHIVNQTDHAGCTSHDKNMNCLDLYGGLEIVIQDIDLIKKDVMEIMITEKNTGAQSCDDQLLGNYSVSTFSGSLRDSSTIAGYDDALINEVLDQLSGRQPKLQIISIYGMGGIGKTVFATYIYWHPLIVEHFDILAWVTISQSYSSRHILLQVLAHENIGSEMSEEDLGERVHKKLWGRRYLIVMDDIWSTEALAKVGRLFPDNKNGSRIMITTRLTNLAFELGGSNIFQMKFLDKDKSWGLLCETVFGKKFGCPIELESIGKEIARNCKGLPLSIVVIGGLLKKSNWTWAHWKYTLENLNSLVNLEGNEYCLQILRASYKELPIYLKPCFLYMGVFPEDFNINVSKLIKLWVAEGILRPIEGKILEEVAEEYVNELIDRNLILVEEFRWNGKAKSCKIHDLLRDLSIREAQKQRFLSLLTRGRNSFNCNLASAKNIFQKAKLPLLSIVLHQIFPCSGFILWNLHTLQINFGSSSEPITAPSEIWNMPLLRHVIIKDVQLPDLPCGEDDLVLEALHTLSRVCNFKCSERVIKKIPNTKILKLKYQLSCKETEYINFGLDNFGHLKVLQSLNIFIDRTYILDGEIFQRNLVQNLSLPHSLKKLTLRGTMLTWDECTTKIGSLPLLEFLRLDWNACWGTEWETVEGQFCNLKYLHVENCDDLRHWRTEDAHFPRLIHLSLRFLDELEEIPSSIGDISTLKSIRLVDCSRSASNSAKVIEEEQLELGNMDLQLHIILDGADYTQEVTAEDALSYLKKVEDTFEYQREKYVEFLDVLSDYKAQRIETDGFVSAVKVLFKGHPSLIPGLNMFFPEGYGEITLIDEEEEAPYIS